MNIFSKIWTAGKSFLWALFGEDAAAAQKVIESNSPIIKAAKPVVADIERLVPDTKVAIELARTEVRSLMLTRLTITEVDQFLEQNFHLGVKDLLRMAAVRLVQLLPIAKGFSTQQLNLAIEFALGILRARV